jgi:hypothetical protein
MVHGARIKRSPLTTLETTCKGGKALVHSGDYLTSSTVHTQTMILDSSNFYKTTPVS